MWRRLCCAGFPKGQPQEAPGAAYHAQAALPDLTVQVSIGSASSAKAGFHTRTPSTALSQCGEQPGHLSAVTRAQLDLLPNVAALYAIEVTAPGSPGAHSCRLRYGSNPNSPCAHAGSLQRCNSEPAALAGAWPAVSSSGSYPGVQAVPSTQEHLLVNAAGLRQAQGREGYLKLLQARCSQDNLLAAVVNDLHRASLSGSGLCCSHTLPDFVPMPAEKQRLSLKVHSCTYEAPSGRMCPALLFLHGSKAPPAGSQGAASNMFGFVLNHISDAVTVFSPEGALLFQNAESINQMGHLTRPMGGCLASPHSTPSICEMETLLLQSDSALGVLFSQEPHKLRDMLEAMRDRTEWSSVIRSARPHAAALPQPTGTVAASAWDNTERRRTSTEHSTGWPVSRRSTKLGSGPFDLLITDNEWSSSPGVTEQNAYGNAETPSGAVGESGAWTIPAVAGVPQGAGNAGAHFGNAAGGSSGGGSMSLSQLRRSSLAGSGSTGSEDMSVAETMTDSEPDSLRTVIDRASSGNSWCSDAAAYLSRSSTQFGFGGAAAVSPQYASALFATADATAGATASAAAGTSAGAAAGAIASTGAGGSAAAHAAASQALMHANGSGTGKRAQGPLLHIHTSSLAVRTSSCSSAAWSVPTPSASPQQRQQQRSSRASLGLHGSGLLRTASSFSEQAMVNVSALVTAGAPGTAPAGQATIGASMLAVQQQQQQQHHSAPLASPTARKSRDYQGSGFSGPQALNRCGSMARCSSSGFGTDQGIAYWSSTEVPTPAMSCSLPLGSRPGSIEGTPPPLDADAAGVQTLLPVTSCDADVEEGGDAATADSTGDAAAAAAAAADSTAPAAVEVEAIDAAVAAVAAFEAAGGGAGFSQSPLTRSTLNRIASGATRSSLDREDSGTSGTCSSAFAPAARLGFDDDGDFGSRTGSGVLSSSDGGSAWAPGNAGMGPLAVRRGSGRVLDARRQLSAELGAAAAALAAAGPSAAAMATAVSSWAPNAATVEEEVNVPGTPQQQGKQQGQQGSPAKFVMRCSSDPPPLYHTTLAPAIPRSVRAFSVSELMTSVGAATAVWPPAATAIATAATRVSAPGAWSVTSTLLGAVASQASLSSAHSLPRLTGCSSMGSPCGHSTLSISGSGLGIGLLGLGGGAFTPVPPSTGASAGGADASSRRSFMTPTPSSPGTGPLGSVMFSPSSRVLLAGCESVQRAPVLRAPSWPRHYSEGGNALVPGKGIASKLLAIRQRTTEANSVQQQQQQQQPAAHSPTAAGPSMGWFQLRAQLIVNPATDQDAILIVQQDVTERVEAESALHELVEAQHLLLESVFPRHIIEVMAICSSGSNADTGLGGMASNARSLDKLQQLASWHPQVTVLFADICGFTAMCKEVAPSVVMSFLNDLYSRFDTLLDIYGVYKVETIGDCYMVAGGLVKKDADGFKSVMAGQVDPLNALRVMDFAKAMLCEARKVLMPTTGQPVLLRVGVHTGPVTSGVVGTRMPRFCLFGDTINMASRMESTAAPGCIHASLPTKVLLPKEPWQPTGGVDVKGKGRCESFVWTPTDYCGTGIDSIKGLERGPSGMSAAAGRMSLDRMDSGVSSGGCAGRRLHYRQGLAGSGGKLVSPGDGPRRSSCDVF